MSSTKTTIWIVGSIILSIILIVVGSLMVNAANNDPPTCKSASWAKFFGWFVIVIGIISLFWNAWSLYKVYRDKKHLKRTLATSTPYYAAATGEDI